MTRSSDEFVDWLFERGLLTPDEYAAWYGFESYDEMMSQHMVDEGIMYITPRGEPSDESHVEPRRKASRP